MVPFNFISTQILISTSKENNFYCNVVHYLYTFLLKSLCCGNLIEFFTIRSDLILSLVTGCCVSLRDFEELGMQTCIPGLVLLVRIARQHGWLLRSCARIYHTVIMLSSHLTANQNKGVTCTYPR